MRSILILSSCYDRPSYYTSRWAGDLHADLIQRKDTICLHYEVAGLGRGGGDLSDAVARVDYIVFYGHGTRDEWIALPELPSAQPPVPAVPLIESSAVSVLGERKVYAGCCWSLLGVGQAFVSLYANGEFVGYDQEFDFDFTNEQYFGEVVNQSVIGYVNGDPAQKVASDLRTEWANLRDRLANGNLKNRPQAAMAAACADRNRQRVGSLP